MIQRLVLFTCLSLSACTAATAQAPVVDPACAWMRAPAAGPLQHEAAAAKSPLDLAAVRVREARLTGDPGFYTLADVAVSCALATDPRDGAALRQRAFLLNQFHRFAEAEAIIRPLATATDSADDWVVLSDSLLDQGDLRGAAEALDRALATETSLRTLDRAAWLVWQQGDLDRAISLERRAVRLGVTGDHEAIAWSLTRLGWFLALADKPTDALDAALVEVPGYRPALIARGRLHLHRGEVEAARADLIAAGDTVAAKVALASIDPTVNVDAVGRQDARGYALWLADHGEAPRAMRLLEGELADRQDAITRVAYAWAAHQAGGDGAAIANEALASGVRDPETLLRAGMVLGKADLVRDALRLGPGLLPPQAEAARAWLAAAR